MTTTTEDEKIYSFKGKTLVTGLVVIIGFVITVTVSVALTFFQFETGKDTQVQLQKDINTLEEDFKELNSETNRRLDTKTKRNEDAINVLKLPGSDK